MSKIISTLLIIILLVMPFSIANSLDETLHEEIKKPITNYNYDAADNLIQIIDNENNTWSYTYDSLGRKISGVDPDTGVSNYTYDAVGNLIAQSTGGGNLVSGDGYYREYDNFGRLKLIRNGNQANSSILEEYIYDGNGDRIKTHNYVKNETTYTPFKEFTMIINSSGTYNYTYIYDSTDTLVARINPDNSKWFYHADHLGSTTLITNESGDMVEEVFYLPYGKPEEEINSENKLYENKEYSNDVDHYYYGARYYDSDKRIFTQPDSIIPDVYDPQQLNIYAFERGNPYSYTDESGNYAVQIGIRGSIAHIPFSSSGSFGVVYTNDPRTSRSEVGVYRSVTPIGIGRFGEGLSATVELTYTPEATEIADIKGGSTNIGGIVGGKVVGGYEYGQSSEGSLESHTAVIGIGYGAEAGISRSYTTTDYHREITSTFNNQQNNLDNTYFRELLSNLFPRFFRGER